jgi:hypothetical protein
VRAETATAAAGHHEADAVAHVRVEGESVRATDELHGVRPQELQELALALFEAPVRVRGEVAVEVRGHVHEHDPVRLVGGREARLEEREVFLPRPSGPLSSSRSWFPTTQMLGIDSGSTSRR